MYLLIICLLAVQHIMITPVPHYVKVLVDLSKLSRNAENADVLDVLERRLLKELSYFEVTRNKHLILKRVSDTAFKCRIMTTQWAVASPPMWVQEGSTTTILLFWLLLCNQHVHPTHKSQHTKLHRRHKNSACTEEKRQINQSSARNQKALPDSSHCFSAKRRT